MCGICGIVHRDKDEFVDEFNLLRMNDSLMHRGPDDEGLFLDENVGLAVRRLSIIDVQGGHQPIFNENKRLCLVFNGEIYNYKELQSNLKKEGHSFRTNSDTEVIIHLYEKYGENCVQYLNGMFAFALWDSYEDKLFLARDRLGIKPLYYLFKNGDLVFGSEIKSVLRNELVDGEINYSALDNYLTFLYIPAPDTIFKGIKKLLPGHTLTYQRGRISINQYWDIDYQNREKRSEEFYQEHLLELLRDSVKLRLISEVPLGAFLSGGMDSSTVVAIMSQLMERPVKTFSIGFDEGSYNELGYAGQIANYYETDHHEMMVEARMVDLLPEIISHFDEPFADSSAIPTYLVAKLARENVTVALTGDGGDESFAGYEWTKMNHWVNRYRRIPTAIRKVLRDVPFSDNHQKILHNKVLNFNSDSLLSPEKSFKRRLTCFTEELKEKLYTASFKDYLENQSANSLDDYFEKAGDFSVDDHMLYIDTKLYLPDDILTKVDRMTMAHSLEARVPFLDHRIVEFAATIPFELKLRGLTSKYILKKAVKDLLPQQIMRQRKQGFSIPIHSWFRDGQLKDYAEDMLLNPNDDYKEFFNMHIINEMWSSHQEKRVNFGHQLWALLVLQNWFSNDYEKKSTKSLHYYPIS